jgi:hypothetical protein
MMTERQNRRGRNLALTIAGTAVIWLGLQGLAPALGTPMRWMFLFDLIALAGFAWVLVQAFWMWRDSQSEEGK